MKITTLASQLDNDIQSLKRPGKRVLIPTMGALHEGHLALIRHGRKLAGDNGCVIVSIFVNPTQFDRPEDLEKYPRTLEKDLARCREEQVGLVFTPDPESMYHPDHSTTVAENSLTRHLCGATRPGHFDGVCTVVLKLLLLSRADIGVFGKKDYQQLAVIRRMARDLNVPTQIEGLDTVREPSGLAMSSRNKRLNPAQLEDAARIRQALLEARNQVQSGETSAQKLLQTATSHINTSTQGAKIDYLELLDAESLQPINTVSQPALLATAVFYDTVRLIDNIELIPG